MGALPTPQPADRYAPYLDDLHEFFADHHLYFGIPADMIPLVERLKHPGPFREQMIFLVQSIQEREGGSLPAAELLEIVGTAVGGQRIHQTPPELHRPISELYDFLNGLTTQSDAPERPPGEILPFPDASYRDAPPVAEKLGEPVASSSRPGLHLGARPFHLPHPSLPSPSFRKLLLAVGIAVVIAVVLAIALRPRTPPAHPAVVRAPAAPAVAHPAKPSPYGEAFTPTPPPKRHRARNKSSSAPTQATKGTSGGKPTNAAH
jgi:hypothetical protein